MSHSKVRREWVNRASERGGPKCANAFYWRQNATFWACVKHFRKFMRLQLFPRRQKGCIITLATLSDLGMERFCPQMVVMALVPTLPLVLSNTGSTHQNSFGQEGKKVSVAVPVAPTLTEEQLKLHLHRLIESHAGRQPKSCLKTV